MRNLVLILLLTIPLLLATPNNITILEKCYNTTIVKVTGNNKTIDPDIIVEDFTFNTEKQWWEHQCNGSPLLITIDNTKENDNNYDVIIQYYVDSLKAVEPNNESFPTPNEIYNEGLKRVENYPNVKLEYSSEPPPKFQDMTYQDMTLVFGLIIIGIVALVLVIGFVYRMLTKSEDDDIRISNKRKTPPVDMEEEELKRLAGLK